MRIVLLHALPLDARMWSADIASLGGDVMAPDLFGLGESIEEWATAVIEMIGTDDVVVVGCSVGGSCALEVARAAPERVRGIVLVGAKADVRPEPARRDEAVRLLETKGMVAGWTELWEPLFGRAARPEVVAAAHAIAVSQDVADVVRGVRAFHDRRDQTDFVASWSRPLIGISGDQDRSPTAAKVAASTTGTGRHFHLVADCGHYVNLEQPERFRSLIAEAIGRCE